MSWNKLLEKQMRIHLPPELLEREEVLKFIDAVNNSYNSYERDRALSAHAFSISEQEYEAVYQQLQKEISLKKIGIRNLAEAIKSIGDGEADNAGIDEDEDNLLFALAYLKESVERQKAMEQQMKSSESRLSATAKTFSQLIKNLNKSILVEDADRRIVLVNQLFCDMFCVPLPPDMLTGMDCTQAAELSKGLFRDPEKFIDRVAAILAARELVTGDELEMADGTILLRDFIPIFVENEYKGNLWMYKNITQERETQKQLHRLSLVASANEYGVIFTDPAGVITWANEGLTRLTGYANEEIIGSTPIALCKGPRSDKESLRIMLEEFHAGKSFAVEVVHYRKNGSWFWGKVKGQAIRDEKGNVVQYFAIIEDFTEKKELELQLIDAKQQAEQSSKAKENFLANMSHEIRTPMNAILGMTRQLQKAGLQPEHRFYLDTIHSAADHLLVVINDILDISKIEAGRMVLENIGFNLGDVARRIHRVMVQKAEEKGLQLSFTIDEAIHPLLKGDPYRLSQVLLNLVSNSIKFTSAGSVTITYSQAGPLVRIVVADTGIGMEEDFLRHLFQKFVQEDEAVARKYGGTGLGMSICKQLVELMGGTISVSSCKGAGTTVTLAIPFLKGVTDDSPVEACPPVDASVLQNKHILLVEDNEMNRLVATTILRNYGAIVKEAVNGAEALTMLRQDTYQLVLMDMQMPVMDGLEATRCIRQDIDGRIPIIALTANAIMGENKKCFAAGMNDYLSKPFEEEDLIRTIARWLDIASPKMAVAERKTLPEQPLYDLSRLREAGRGNEAFVSRMVKLFLEQVPGNVREIVSACAGRDLAAVKAMVHRIRPVIDNLGIVSLRTDLKEMERLAAMGGDGGALDPLVRRLDEVIGKVVRDLEDI